MIRFRAAFAAALLVCMLGAPLAAQAAPSPSGQPKAAAPRLADPYAQAPAQVRAAVEKARALAGQGKWKSALDSLAALDPGASNGYLLAARVELGLEGYVGTLMHRMFAYKDLGPGESLEALRASDLEFDMAEFDPLSLAQAQEDAGLAPPPVLSKSLGDYLYAVQSVYGEQWLVPLEAVVSYGIERYAAARAGGVYDARSLGREAELLSRVGRAEEADPLYRAAIALDPAAPEPHFEYAMGLYFAGRLAETLAELDFALAGFKDTERLFEAYAFAARAAADSGDVARSDRYLAGAERLYPEDPAPGLMRHLLAVERGDSAAADLAADALVARFAASPYVIRSLISSWLESGGVEEARAFVKRSLAAAKDDEAAGAVLFYYAILEAQASAEGPTPAVVDRSLGLLKEAEARFLKVYAKDHEVFAAIESLRADLAGMLESAPVYDPEAPPADGGAEGAAEGAAEGEVDATSAASEEW